MPAPANQRGQMLLAEEHFASENALFTETLRGVNQPVYVYGSVLLRSFKFLHEAAELLALRLGFHGILCHRQRVLEPVLLDEQVDQTKNCFGNGSVPQIRTSRGHARSCADSLPCSPMFPLPGARLSSPKSSSFQPALSGRF
jgi:hypothetical protein